MSQTVAKKPDIAEDRPFQERFWRVERVAWIGFGLVVISATAGLFGSGGPLASGTTEIGTIRVEYPTIARWQADEEFFFRLAGKAGERRLMLSSAFIAAFRVDDLHPPPERVEAVPMGETYVFRATTDAPIDVRVAVTPRSVSYIDYQVAAADGPPVRLSTFVWP